MLNKIKGAKALSKTEQKNVNGGSPFVCPKAYRVCDSRTLGFAYSTLACCPITVVPQVPGHK